MSKFFRYVIFAIFVANFLTIQPVFGQAPNQANDHNLPTNGSVFVPLNQTIPPEVLEAKKSFVAVRMATPRLYEDQDIHIDQDFGLGVTVFDNYVLAALHLIGPFPTIWFSNRDSGELSKASDISIFDGDTIFAAKIDSLDYSADLVLLKVVSPNPQGKIFNLKPAKIAAQTFVVDPKTNEPKVLFERFYAFSFFTKSPRAYFSLQLGPYLTVTNLLKESLVVPIGIVQGAIEPGFSGGPLVSPDGSVMGIVSKGSAVYTYVVTVETINYFLEVAKKRLTQKP